MSEAAAFWHYFTPDYASARERFVVRAQRAGAQLASYRHPDASGPGGIALSIDVARLGPQHAPKQLLAISGTHGLEGAAGSALQIAWLDSLASNLPPDLAVTLVHGLNPYGFAHGSRTTENNVDLNRNFVDHDAPRPRNAHYASLHEWLIPTRWDRDTLAAATQATDRFRDAHGADALFNTLASGQYTHADGLIYGGNQREWSNLTLQRIVETHLVQAERVAFIDWHTGIGEYGEPFFLCFNAQDSELEQRAAQWWGADRVLGQRPHGLARPDYRGLVFRGVEQFLDGRPMAGAVIEFGTRGPSMSLASRLDQWLRFRARQAPHPERDAQLRADLLDAFVPVSSVWRERVLAHGLAITAQTLDGLARW
ncbi:M14 family metallopeptidase [Paraburkholderia sp. JHI869]|uniref:M14 family metallopeptidase n=1 Tax=Paraburkholderia sp. JHI869 TaxID=3112959 RepID=UPI0031730EE8